MPCRAGERGQHRAGGGAAVLPVLRHPLGPVRRHQRVPLLPRRRVHRRHLGDRLLPALGRLPAGAPEQLRLHNVEIVSLDAWKRLVPLEITVRLWAIAALSCIRTMTRRQNHKFQSCGYQIYDPCSTRCRTQIAVWHAGLCCWHAGLCCSFSETGTPRHSSLRVMKRAVSKPPPGADLHEDQRLLLAVPAGHNPGPRRGLGHHHHRQHARQPLLPPRRPQPRPHHHHPCRGAPLPSPPSCAARLPPAASFAAAPLPDGPLLPAPPAPKKQKCHAPGARAATRHAARRLRLIKFLLSLFCKAMVLLQSSYRAGISCKH